MLPPATSTKIPGRILLAESCGDFAARVESGMVGAKVKSLHAVPHRKNDNPSPSEAL